MNSIFRAFKFIFINLSVHFISLFFNLFYCNRSCYCIHRFVFIGSNPFLFINQVTFLNLFFVTILRFNIHLLSIVLKSLLNHLIFCLSSRLCNKLIIWGSRWRKYFIGCFSIKGQIVLSLLRIKFFSSCRLCCDRYWTVLISVKIFRLCNIKSIWKMFNRILSPLLIELLSCSWTCNLMDSVRSFYLWS